MHTPVSRSRALVGLPPYINVHFIRGTRREAVFCHLESAGQAYIQAIRILKHQSSQAKGKAHQRETKHHHHQQQKKTEEENEGGGRGGGWGGVYSEGFELFSMEILFFLTKAKIDN